MTDPRLIHGHCTRRGGKTPEYVAWLAMKARCSANEDHPDFLTYVSKGIAVCERWDDFITFLSDLGPKPSPNHSLGRIDNDLGYFPENCHWETAKEQMINTRASMRWHICGTVFVSCRDAGRALGVDQSTIRRWVRTQKEHCYAVKKY